MRLSRQSSAAANLILLPQLDFGGALAALVVRGFGDRGDVRMVAEVFAQGAAQDAHACAVHDADARQASQEGAVEEALYFVVGLVSGAADDVDLRGHVVGLDDGGDGDSAAAARGLERCFGLRW